MKKSNRTLIAGEDNSSDEQGLRSDADCILAKHPQAECFDEITGGGGQEIPGFYATRHELTQLVTYWTKVHLDNEYQFFLTGSVSSWDVILPCYGERRIARISNLLDKATVRNAINTAYQEFGSGQDARRWKIFLHGTAEERGQVQEEFYRELKASREEHGND